MSQDRLVVDVLHELGYLVGQCSENVPARFRQNHDSRRTEAAGKAPWRIQNPEDRDVIANRKSDRAYRICSDGLVNVVVEVDGQFVDNLAAGECIDVEGKVITISSQGASGQATGTYERID